MALNDLAVHRTDLVRQHRHLVADADVADRNVLEDAAAPPMRERRDPAAPARAAPTVASATANCSSVFSARQHQHDDRAGEVLAEQRRGDDRDTGEVIRAELARAARAMTSRSTSGTPPATSATKSGRYTQTFDAAGTERSHR